MQGPGEPGRRREHGEFQKGKCEWREVELCDEVFGSGLSETSRMWLKTSFTNTDVSHSCLLYF